MNNMCKENFVHDGEGFHRFCHITLDATRKKKHAWGNQIPFFNKELSKVIMTRTKLRTMFLQNRREENRIHYTKQEIFVPLF